MTAVRKPRDDKAGKRPARARPVPGAVVSGEVSKTGVASPARALQAQLHQQLSVVPVRVLSRFVTPFLGLVMLKAWLVGQTLYTPGVTHMLGTLG